MNNPPESPFVQKPSQPLPHYLHERKLLVDQALDHWLPAADKPPKRLNEAMRYSLMAGGKRLRPILVLAAAEAVGGSIPHAMPFACAMECVHTYSLIHDDLPAMDDDDLRRGLPTCHKQFDEATAILAGDGLLTMAFWLATQLPDGVSPKNVLSVVHQLAQDAGVFGMVGGQMMDILAEDQTLELAELQNIHIHKTGALIRCACLAGAILGNGSPDQIRALKRYGEAIGLAFQIMDDILDETGNPAILGKSIGADRKKAKATYPLLLGLPQAREEAGNLCDQAVHWLSSFSTEADPLRDLARFIVTRTH